MVSIEASWPPSSISNPRSTQSATVRMRPFRLVLDTNVVLDTLVFHDSATRELVAALEARRVQALVCRHTLDELKRVLCYSQFRLTASERQDVLDRYLALGSPAELPEGFDRDTLLLPAGFPRCRDVDDEPFLALAYHARADGLVTKDKALLKLRKKARRFGLTILGPATLSSLQ